MSTAPYNHDAERIRERLQRRVQKLREPSRPGMDAQRR
jgi:hypothetical protein